MVLNTPPDNLECPVQVRKGQIRIPIRSSASPTGALMTRAPRAPPTRRTGLPHHWVASFEDLAHVGAIGLVLETLAW